ncbi:BREX-2 system adenine-specific DNA-methyltransferase PglX [Streptomyces sp. NPDC013187]|uniref:BREX-2 system adenine-specific DNA-methyltransferase PglX n=1 Tax=Streptomyces sp. NPDC013187 TaxID=3364865 RepID=UPI0036CC9873
MGSVIDSDRLRDDLQKQLLVVEKDLQDQLETLPEVKRILRDEYHGALKAKRTAISQTEWVGERITQSAVAWLLGTVFVRFCEDNLILIDPYVAGSTIARQTHAEERHVQFMTDDPARTHRDWLLEAFKEIGSWQAGRLLFDEEHNPLFQIPMSHEGAKGLIEFWRKHEEVEGGTRIIHNFQDSEWNTRFLGDLYQDLSSSAREKYALLQTPEFVEKFILERTLDPALGEFDHSDIRMIDPTCGSGHFVLGAFHRILQEWEIKAPSVDVHDRVRGALRSVHGVDLNPFAVAIARFRLIIAALRAAGVADIMEALKYEWPLNLAVGDSLIYNSDEVIEGLREASDGELADYLYSTEDLDRYPKILDSGRYHVVVGNPPYIVPGSDSPKSAYKKLYKSCSGKYQLTVPFGERFFLLAIRSVGGATSSGYVGQITGSAFTKREFGEKFIQHYLAVEVDLTEVIDTSGAYLPGHGTPTVILVGRNRPARDGARTVRSVRRIQGEPKVPDVPAEGKVWCDITSRIDAPGRSVGDWVSADDLDRKRYFSKHPWILDDGGLETVEEINSASGKILRSILSRDIGFASFPGQDPAFIGTRRSLSRRDVECARPLITGDIVRDWDAHFSESAVVPYDPQMKPLAYDHVSPWGRYLWPSRQVLRATHGFEKVTDSRDLTPWWGWYRWVSDRYRGKYSIVCAEVTTHNQFILDRGGSCFKQSVSIAKLGDGASVDDYLSLVGLLNSSVACFWLKQMCQIKPSNGVGRGLEAEKWTVWYQFNGANVQEFPLPEEYPLTRATELDTLAQQLAAVTPSTVAADPEKPPTAEVLAQVKSEWHRIRARMITIQEELDWEVYGIYGLHDDLTAPEDALPADGIALGQRAFEIDLGKRVKEQGVKTEWFRRHKSKMISEIPAEWPEAYKETVRRRLDAMKNSSVIGLIERPEYKRRWLTDGWDVQQQAALKEWLLARMERRELWYETDYDGTERPRTRSLPELVDDLTGDHDFVAVAELYAPGEELSVIVPKLVEDQHVPFLAALRYTEAAHKKKREVWEQVWERQREEDAATAAGDHLKAMEIRDGTPVPPKYTTADFRKASYAAQRGGLDVPKERFISYSRTLNPAIEVLGWGGWDHLEQAAALTETIDNRANSGNWEREDFIPYLAGLLELLPWLKQWHPEDAGMFEEALLDWQREEEFAVTDEELRAWRPVRKAAKKATAKPAGGKSAKKSTQAKE